MDLNAVRSYFCTFHLTFDSRTLHSRPTSSNICRLSLAGSEPARSGFLTTDLSGVSYVVLILPSRGQLRLIRLDSAADGAHTVRGQGTTLQARDAVSIPVSRRSGGDGLCCIEQGCGVDEF